MKYLTTNVVYNNTTEPDHQNNIIVMILFKLMCLQFFLDSVKVYATDLPITYCVAPAPLLMVSFWGVYAIKL